MKQPNTRTIGLFVVGAVTLAVVGLIAFGRTSAYFEHRPRAVTFFHGSVAGLVVGAPVTFRGVRVGGVVDIAIEINPGTGAAQIPVIMEFEPERVSVSGADTKDEKNFAKKMLSNGLGASLVMQSLITGQQAIELDYHPDSEETRTGINLGIPEIPEARGGLSAMKDTISKLPIQQLADDAVATLRALKELISAPELQGILKNTAETTKAAARVTAAAETQLEGLGKDARETTLAARHTIERLDALLADLQPRLGAAMTTLDRALANTDQRTGQIAGDLHATLGDIHSLLTPRAPSYQDIQTVLHNLAVTTGSLRSFADQVDRNPNSLLMGRSSR